MKKLPPAKRNQLIVVIAVTIIVLGLEFFLLISPQKEQNTKLAANIRTKQDKLQTIKNAIKQTEAISSSLVEITRQLNESERDVASGDVYAWTYDLIRHFKANYRVEIPNIGQPYVSEVDLLPGIPYKQVKITLTGNAFYHELGRFVSDFENTFPHIRMLNLAVEPMNSTGLEAERISFRVDIVALVKPNT